MTIEIFNECWLWFSIIAILAFVWAPKSWVPGELVSAASMNTNIRDHLNESLRTQATTLVGAQNNFALEGPFAYLKSNSASALTLTGALIDGGNVDGAKVIIEALVSAVTLNHQNAGSTTSNRFITPDAGNLVLAVNERALLIYDGTAERWRANRADAYQLTQALADITAAEGDITTAEGKITALENINGTACRCFNNANISTNDSTYTILTFNTDRYDPDNLHDPGSNPSRITIAVSGHYLIGGHLNFAYHAGGARFVEILQAANVLARSQIMNATTVKTDVFIVTHMYLNAAEYVELRVWQSSGGALNVEYNAKYSPEFWVQRVGT